MFLRTKAWSKALYLGWWVLAASVGLQILTASFTLQSFGAYIAVIQKDFGWSITSLSAAFAIQQALGGFLGPVLGWVLQRTGPKRMIRFGLAVFCLGLILLSLVQSLLAFYAAVVVIALGASAAGFLPLNTLAVQWFDRYRSTALALMQTGISAAGLVVPLITWSLESNGWRATAVMTSIFVFIVGYALTFIIGDKPEDYGLEPDGVSSTKDTAVTAAYSFLPKEALRTRAFWFIALGHGLALAVVFSVLAHMVIFLTSDRGISLQLAGTLVALMTSMSIVGQLLGGFLGDAFNKRLIATLAMFGHAAGMLLLAYGSGLVSVLAFAVIHGLSWGLRGPIMQSMRADYFGRAYFGQIMGFSSPIITFGMVGGPLLVGILFDFQGNYQIGFTVLAIGAALGSLFFVFAAPPKLPDHATKTL